MTSVSFKDPSMVPILLGFFPATFFDNINIVLVKCLWNLILICDDIFSFNWSYVIASNHTFICYNILRNLMKHSPKIFNNIPLESLGTFPEIFNNIPRNVKLIDSLESKWTVSAIPVFPAFRFAFLDSWFITF